MKTSITCDFSSVRKLNSEIFEDITVIKNEFDNEAIEIIADRAKVNCPESDKTEKEIKNSIAILSKKKKGKSFEAVIGTNGSKDALKLHEHPRIKQKSDKNTIEGGQDNKFLSKTAEYHFKKSFPRLVLEKNRKKGYI